MEQHHALQPFAVILDLVRVLEPEVDTVTRRGPLGPSGFPGQTEMGSTN